jgi:hypothetical protein
VIVDDGAGAIGSCPRSVLGVTADAGAGAGAIGATGFGRGIGLATDVGAGLFGAALIGAAFLGAGLFGAAFFATAFLGAAFLAFLATLALLAFFAGRAFFFAMVSLLLGVNPILVRVALKKSAVICARRWSRRWGLRTLPS